MYRNTWAMKVFAMLAVLSLLTGCSGGSPVAPTIDTAAVEATAAAIKTEAANTVLQDLTKNAPTATQTSQPTNTSEPATATATTEPTATTSAATATIAPTNTIVYPTWTSAPSGTPAPSATPSSFKCSVTEQSPSTGLEVRKGGDFDASWTVKNTGSEAWSANGVDFKYISGEKMHEGNDARDLGSDVATDGTIKLVLDMMAPDKTGRFTETWGLVSGSNTLCVFSVTINAVE